jgi:hypothetical protein
MKVYVYKCKFSNFFKKSYENNRIEFDDDAGLPLTSLNNHSYNIPGVPVNITQLIKNKAIKIESGNYTFFTIFTTRNNVSFLNSFSANNFQSNNFFTTDTGCFRNSGSLKTQHMLYYTLF